MFNKQTIKRKREERERESTETKVETINEEEMCEKCNFLRGIGNRINLILKKRKKQITKEHKRRTNIHSHNVVSLLGQRFAVALELIVAARVITALFDKTRPGIDSWLVFAAIRKRLVVATFPTHEVQGVAQASGAQFLHPDMRLSQGDLAVGDVQNAQENQHEQKHRSRFACYTIAVCHLNVSLDSKNHD